MEEKLIEAVRIRNVLYDTSHVDYMRSKVKAEKWKEVAKEVGIKSGVEAKTLWEKLRHSLRDAIRRKRKSLESGVPAHFIKEWKFEKEMGFLQPYLTNKWREESFREDANNDESLTQNFEDKPSFVYVEMDNLEEPYLQQQNESAQSQKLPKETLPATSAATSSSTANPTPAKKIKKDNVLKQSKEKSAHIDHPNDSLYHFFMSMYHSTKRMPPQSQYIFRKGVFKVVTEVEATLLNIVPAYEEFTPYYKQSFYNNHAASQSHSSNSTPDHSNSDNSMLGTVDVRDEEETKVEFS